MSHPHFVEELFHKVRLSSNYNPRYSNGRARSLRVCVYLRAVRERERERARERESRFRRSAIWFPGTNLCTMKVRDRISRFPARMRLHCPQSIVRRMCSALLACAYLAVIFSTFIAGNTPTWTWGIPWDLRLASLAALPAASLTAVRVCGSAPQKEVGKKTPGKGSSKTQCNLKIITSDAMN